jgi:hypothetical protein
MAKRLEWQIMGQDARRIMWFAPAVHYNFIILHDKEEGTYSATVKNLLRMQEPAEHIGDSIEHPWNTFAEAERACLARMRQLMAKFS